jgi:hypothetical protein
MKALYLAYAAVVIGLLSLSHSDKLIINIALWVLLAFWLGALISVLLRLWWSRWLALAALLPVLAGLLFQSGERIALMIDGGKDYSISDGSTVAFLIGLVGELVLLIPGLILYVWMLDASYRITGFLTRE